MLPASVRDLVAPDLLVLSGSLERPDSRASFLRLDFLVGSIRVFSQYGHNFHSIPTGLSQEGQGSRSLERQLGHFVKSGSAG